MTWIKLIQWSIAFVFGAFSLLCFFSAALAQVRVFLKDVVMMYFQQKAEYYKQMAVGPLEQLLRDVRTDRPLN